MSGSVSVRPVRTPSDLKQFIGFPYDLHRRHPFWVPPLRRDVKAMLSPEKNPFFQHADAEHFIATREEKIYPL